MLNEFIKSNAKQYRIKHNRAKSLMKINVSQKMPLQFCRFCVFPSSACKGVKDNFSFNYRKTFPYFVILPSNALSSFSNYFTVFTVF